jgi:hypothetical protein
MLKALVTAAATLALTCTVALAEPTDMEAPEVLYGGTGVSYDETSHTVTIVGSTTSTQAFALSRLARDKDIIVVIMSGPGGDFYAGLRIGRLLQREGVIVIIPKDTTCISACAFIALAGERVILHENSALMFHTPYVTHVPVGLTILDIVNHFAGAYHDMTSYLVSVNIPLPFGRSLIDVTSPCKFVTVSSQEAINKLMTGDSLTVNRNFDYEIQDLCNLAR